MSIIAQEVSATRLFIRTARGSVELFPIRIKAEFDRMQGTREQRYRSVSDWIRSEIVTVLGTENINPDAIDFDFDENTGEVVRCEHHAEPIQRR